MDFAFIIAITSCTCLKASNWLQQNGISHKLAWWYAEAGWLSRISDGAYIFAGDTANWAGAIATLQQQLNLPIFPGCMKPLFKTKTSLENASCDVDIKFTGDLINQLLVTKNLTTIKIEPNLVLRGTVFGTEEKELSPLAQKAFQRTLTIKTVSFEDLYAGKICAALDRQHPRDLFDIKLLTENEGISDKLRQAFIAYLLSSPRPMNELLAPSDLNMKQVYSKEFVGMTVLPVSYDDLILAKQKLITSILYSIKSDEKAFLLSVKHGNPLWHLMPIPHLAQLPAVKWKMQKQAKKRAILKLSAVFNT